jgi:hypothetical protein
LFVLVNPTGNLSGLLRCPPRNGLHGTWEDRSKEVRSAAKEIAGRGILFGIRLGFDTMAVAGEMECTVPGLFKPKDIRKVTYPPFAYHLC